MLIQSKQDLEPLYALAWVCLCPADPTSCSCSPFPNKTRNLSLLPAHTVYWQEPLPSQLAQCIHRTATPDPGLVNPESFMEASRFAGALLKGIESIENLFLLEVVKLGANIFL